MTFVENFERFAGTGERNAAGESLEEFLQKYDAKKYDCPSNTVDMLVFRSEEAYRSFSQPLKLLMIKRKNHPSIGFWALPGGFVNLREDMADAAARELQEETGVTGVPLVQLRAWGEADRDPRWRVITTSYLALVEGALPVHAGDDAADALWFDVELKEAKEDGPAPAGDAHETREEQVYTLTLRSRERPVTLSARVERTIIKRGVLKDVRYRLLETEGIASDHGCLIVDGLLHLKKCCEEQ